LGENKLLENWKRCGKYIQDALQYAGGTHTIDDVYHAVASGKAQFHPLEKSAIITEIVDYPQRAVCRIWLAGGELDELMQAEKSIAVWAKSVGCDGMEIVGRKGWQRQLKDYTATSVVLVKDISDV
jgi:hypothetical protein